VDVLFFKEFASPPILKRTWDVFTPLVQEADRYFGSWEFMNWRGGGLYRTVFGWQSLLTIAALVRASRTAGPLGRVGLFGLWIMLGFALLVGQKAANYLSVLAPLAALSLADWLTAPGVRWRTEDFLPGLAAFLVFFPLGSFPLAVTAVLFALLPRDVFQKVMLGVLLCAFFNVPTVRSWAAEVPRSFLAFWPVSLAGLALAGGLWAARRWSVPSVTSCVQGAAAVVAVGTLLFAGAVAASKPAFGDLCRDVAREIPAGARVAGPQPLWLGLSSLDYRDIGALTWHHLLLNSRDISRPLAAWKADYVILDPPMIRQLQRYVPPGGPVFPWPHHLVREIDGGPVYGKLYLVKMDWPS
jgi:hypothetical protein